jgi:hypothetical protein
LNQHPHPTQPARRRVAVRPLLLGLGALLLFGIGTPAMVASEWPAIRDDLAVRDAARPIPGLRMTEGRCRSRLFLLQSCEVTLAWSGKSGNGTRRLAYTFVEPHAGDWSLTAVADPARPELATTDLGLDRLTNRIATMVGLAVVGAAMAIGGGIGALRALRGRAG